MTRVPRLPGYAALRKLALESAGFGAPPAAPRPKRTPASPPRRPTPARQPFTRTPAAGVEAAEPRDDLWIKPLLRAQEELYGGGDIAWRRFWRTVNNGHSRALAEFWDVIRPYGFCHWRLRRDGSRAIDELVVAPAGRNLGIGGKLLQSVGLPVQVHALPGDVRAARFLRNHGLQPAGRVALRNGTSEQVRYVGN